MTNYRDILIESIVTCGYIGKIKYAPGTFGSLLAFPVSYILVSLILASGFRITTSTLSMNQGEFVTVIVVFSIIILLLFILGVVLSSKYIKKIGREDPKEIVIDELVGQMVVIIFGSLSSAFMHLEGSDKYINSTLLDFLCFFLLPFVLFRIFDIYKPFPIDWIDRNLRGGIGVMVDDLFAAIFALVAQYAITFVVIDLLA